MNLMHNDNFSTLTTNDKPMQAEPLTMNNQKHSVFIIDDEPTAIERLKQAIAPYSSFGIVGNAQSSKVGKKLLLEIRPDILFIDMELNDSHGLNLLSEIKDQITWKMKVIFYTAYSQYMINALRGLAFDFLLKPFADDDLKEILVRYLNDYTSNAKSASSPIQEGLMRLSCYTAPLLVTTSNNQMRTVHLEEILLLEHIKSSKRWDIILTDMQRITLKKTTCSDHILGYSKFLLQVSQHVILNINYVCSIDKKVCKLYPPYDVRLGDIPISRTFMREISERFWTI